MLCKIPTEYFRKVEKYNILYRSELIGFWTLSIVQYSKFQKIREHNVSETGSVSFLRSGGRGWFLVSWVP
jgi:hypothetical protein